MLQALKKFLMLMPAQSTAETKIEAKTSWTPPRGIILLSFCASIGRNPWLDQKSDLAYLYLYARFILHRSALRRNAAASAWCAFQHIAWGSSS